jgi:hypothetical protein
MRRQAYIMSGQQARDMQMTMAQNEWVFNWVTNNMIQNQNSKPSKLR